jgi:hypothetical protein
MVIMTAYPPSPHVALRHETLRQSGVGFLTLESMATHSMRNALTLAAVNRTPKEKLKRIFLGQLTHDVCPITVSAICLAVTGCAVVHAEVITKKDPATGAYATTGCCHAYCKAEDAPTIFARFHKRVLVDVNGVWVSQRAEHTTALKKYVAKTRGRTTTSAAVGGPFSSAPAELPSLLSTAQVATTQYCGLRHKQPPMSNRRISA